jgi:hypothetical protein
LTPTQAFIAGFACTCAIYCVIDYIAGYFEYVRFKKWLESIDVSVRSLDEKAFDKYYAMWELSKLPNITITEVTDKDKQE